MSYPTLDGNPPRPCWFAQHPQKLKVPTPAEPVAVELPKRAIWVACGHRGGLA